MIHLGPRTASSVMLQVLLLFAMTTAHAQKWINPPYDAHRLDYRDLGYPDLTAIQPDDCPITALLTASGGHIYGATSGRQAWLFLYDRAINKVRPLGPIQGAQGVYHALVQDSTGTLLIGGGLNMLAPVPLTQKFPGGFRAIEDQLWKDIAAPYAQYEGGHLYRYDPAKSDAEARLPGEPCPLVDLGIPVKGDSIYALALDAPRRQLYGITYPNAHFFVWDLKKDQCRDVGPVLERKVYSGPERTWRSIPRALYVAPDGRVFTSGEDGRIVVYDPQTRKLASTEMQLPGEYYEAWNYYGYPVVEHWVRDAAGRLFGGSSDGYLFQVRLDNNELVNLGKPRLSRRVRAMTLGPDGWIYMICGEFQEPCKLIGYDPSGRAGFRDLGVLSVDRSPYYAKRAYQFDAMATGIDGTIFIGESDRRASLFLFFPGGKGFPTGFNPANPR